MADLHVFTNDAEWYVAESLDDARELCRDALVERDKARRCEQTALDLLADLAAELRAAQAKVAALTAELAQERADVQEVMP